MPDSAFTTRGPLTGDRHIYIERQADLDLLEICRAGGYATVLAPPHNGKSSLMLRTVGKLSQTELKAVTIDLVRLSTPDTTAETWCVNFLTRIEEQLGLASSAAQWWDDLRHLDEPAKLAMFFDKILPAEVAAPVVVFVDSLEAASTLEFRDDIFTTLQALYAARSRRPTLKQLAFVLVGRATALFSLGEAGNALLKLGRAVSLTDFTFEAATPLAQGLTMPAEQAQQILGWTLAWTGGQPYLTQRLLQQVRQQNEHQPPDHWSESAIKAVVAATFFGQMRWRDPHLQLIRDSLTQGPQAAEVLSLYQAILAGQTVPGDENRAANAYLKSSGVVTIDQDQNLRLRNKIYERVFDRSWLAQFSLWLRDAPSTRNVAWPDFERQATPDEAAIEPSPPAQAVRLGPSLPWLSKDGLLRTGVARGVTLALMIMVIGASLVFSISLNRRLAQTALGNDALASPLPQVDEAALAAGATIQAREEQVAVAIATAQAIVETARAAEATAQAIAGDRPDQATAYDQLIQTVIKTNNVELNVNVCRDGSLAGIAAVVLPACERALELAPSYGPAHDSRGLARALLGDFAGAIEDFESYLAWLEENGPDEARAQHREAWIAELEAGRNPFDEAILERLQAQSPAE